MSGQLLVTERLAPPHHVFKTLDRFIDYVDSHRRYSPHAVTVYSYLADLHFIAEGEPYEYGDALKYYNPCCCINLRLIEGIEELIKRARDRIARGEVPPDWRDEFVRVMQLQMTEKAQGSLT